MAQKEYPVYGDGIKGVLIGPARFLDESKERLVRLEDGTELRVPSNALEPQPDGSFYLRSRQDSAQPQVNAPLAAASNLQPQITVAERPLEAVAPASPAAPVQPESADAVMFRHGYSVRKVAVDRVLDEPVGPRQEGDTMIYPVMEEVLVVQKKLILREEIHVTPERSPIEPRRIEMDANGSQHRNR